MQVDVTFDFAKVYNIEKIDVAKGQRFALNTDYTEPSKWFSDNDPVLALKVSGNNAEAEAKEVGTSTVLIMSSAFGIEKTLTINVVEQVVPMAVDLGVSSGDVLFK
jgi:hypothetical protein